MSNEKEEWVNIYGDKNGRFLSDESYISYDQAFEGRDKLSSYIDTVRLVKNGEQGIAMTGDFKKEEGLLLDTSAGEVYRWTKRVIREAKRLSDYDTRWNLQSAVEHLEKAMEEYKSAPDPTDKTEGWIDIKRSRWLPDYDRPVLWLQDNGNMFVDSLDKDGNPFLQHVTHWQNLPSPPEGTKIIKNKNT